MKNSNESDILSDQLGLDQLHDFSFKNFILDSFKPYSSDDLELRLGCGTPFTTPAISHDMGQFPKPWVFIRVFAFTILAYLILYCIIVFYKHEAIRLLPALIFTGCFAVPISVLILFFELNTLQNISIFFIIKLFTLGGAVSFLFTFLLSDIFPIITALYGDSAAGFIEEISKISAVILLTRVKFLNTNYWILNGLLCGAAVGTGFAAFESAGYALDLGLLKNSFLELNYNLIIRGFLAPFMHITWTAISAAAFFMAMKEHETIFNSIFSSKFMSFFIISISIHFLWNLNLEIPFTPPLSKQILLGLFSWAIVFRLVATGLSEVRLYKKVLS